ncbi:MAG: hypothetical protein ACJAYI_000394 [Myxococcota bacterium]|jgi:hypothetical protein
MAKLSNRIRFSTTEAAKKTGKDGIRPPHYIAAVAVHGDILA